MVCGRHRRKMRVVLVLVWLVYNPLSSVSRRQSSDLGYTVLCLWLQSADFSLDVRYTEVLLMLTCAHSCVCVRVCVCVSGPTHGHPGPAAVRQGGTACPLRVQYRRHALGHHPRQAQPGDCSLCGGFQGESAPSCMFSGWPGIPLNSTSAGLLGIPLNNTFCWVAGNPFEQHVCWVAGNPFEQHVCWVAVLRNVLGSMTWKTLPTRLLSLTEDWCGLVLCCCMWWIF